jgi:hypothetical protein
MRYVSIAAVVCSLLLTGCLAMVPDDMAVTGYHGVRDRADFWIKEWEAAGAREGVDFRGAPEEMKRCAGEEMVKMSPPDLNQAVDRFIANQNVGNYKALVPLVRRFSSGYEKHTVSNRVSEWGRSVPSA